MRALDHNKAAKCQEYSQDVGHAGNVGGRRGLQSESAQEDLAFYSSRDCTHIQSEAKLHERQQNAPEVAVWAVSCNCHLRSRGAPWKRRTMLVNSAPFSETRFQKQNLSVFPARGMCTSVLRPFSEDQALVCAQKDQGCSLRETGPRDSTSAEPACISTYWAPLESGQLDDSLLW